MATEDLAGGWRPSSYVTDLATANDGLKRPSILDRHRRQGTEARRHRGDDPGGEPQQRRSRHRARAPLGSSRRTSRRRHQEPRRHRNQVSSSTRPSKTNSKSLKLIGKLGSLSEKFARDYGPLTAKSPASSRWRGARGRDGRRAPWLVPFVEWTATTRPGSRCRPDVGADAGLPLHRGLLRASRRRRSRWRGQRRIEPSPAATPPPSRPSSSPPQGFPNPDRRHGLDVDKEASCASSTSRPATRPTSARCPAASQNLTEVLPRLRAAIYDGGHPRPRGGARIEEHTSSDWYRSGPREAYLNNMELSQHRARAVLAFLLNLGVTTRDPDFEAWFQRAPSPPACRRASPSERRRQRGQPLKRVDAHRPTPTPRCGRSSTSATTPVKFDLTEPGPTAEPAPDGGPDRNPGCPADWNRLVRGAVQVTGEITVGPGNSFAGRADGRPVHPRAGQRAGCNGWSGYKFVANCSPPVCAARSWTSVPSPPAWTAGSTAWSITTPKSPRGCCSGCACAATACASSIGTGTTARGAASRTRSSSPSPWPSIPPSTTSASTSRPDRRPGAAQPLRHSAPKPKPP